MKILPRIFRSSAAVVTGGQLAEQSCIFVRNLLIVRSLTPDAYGAAATLLISLTIIQASTDFGVQKLLIQARDGDTAIFQSTAQFANFLQGLLVAVLLFIAGPFLAGIFDLPNMACAYQTLALVPLLLGLIHYDIFRDQRKSRFGQSVFARVVGQLLSLMVVIALLPYFDDYQIVLWSILAIPVGSVITSHVIAHRAFRFSLDRKILRRSVSFGWPLVANGVFFAIVNQSDRFLLGSAERLLEFAGGLSGTFRDVTAFTKVDLGVYSIALMLTFMPTRFIVGTLSTILFPLLARLQDDRERMHRLYATGLRINALLAALLSLGFTLFGSALVGILYGEVYRSSVGEVIGILALVQGARLIRIPSIGASLALGDSRLVMYSNMFRALSVVGSATAVLLGLPLSVFAGVALATELGAVVIAVYLLNRSHGFPRNLSTGGLAFFLICGGVGFLGHRQLSSLSDGMLFLVTAGAMAAVLAVAAVALPGIYREGRILITSREKHL